MTERESKGWDFADEASVNKAELSRDGGSSLAAARSVSSCTSTQEQAFISLLNQIGGRHFPRSASHSF